MRNTHSALKVKETERKFALGKIYPFHLTEAVQQLMPSARLPYIALFVERWGLSDGLVYNY